MIPNGELEFHAGESIHTENSYNFTVAEFGELGSLGGFRQVAAWCDKEALFGVQLLKAASLR